MIDQPTTFNEEIYLIKDKTTVILSEPWDQIAEADRHLLQKILQSVRLSLASVRILHTTNPELFNSPTTRVIYFGAAEIKTEGMTVQAPRLSQLQNDTSGKQKLWVALKQLFSL
jgi:DNA polymerase III psi subunit